MTAPKPVTSSVTSDSYGWIGPTGGSWGALGNWSDVTTSTNPAEYIPGTLTPVTITGPGSTTQESITGGGSAASIALTGNISLAGSYKVVGAVDVGNMALAPFSTYRTGTPGALTLAKGGTLAAGTVNVLDGTFSLAGGTKVSATGAVTIGSAQGGNSEAGPGVVNLVSGAALSVAGGVSVDAGMLGDAGGVVTIGSTLSVGTAGTDPSATPDFNQESSLVAVTAGGTLTVTGAITEQSGLVVADGAGSKLVATGILTAAARGGYEGFGKSAPGSERSGNVAAVNGGSVQLGGLGPECAPGLVVFDAQSGPSCR